MATEYTETAVFNLVLYRQDSLAKEKYSKNSILKDTHVVAKTLPFLMEIGSPISLVSARLTAILCYDSDSGVDFKLVDTVKSLPLTYKVHLNDDGTKAIFEIKITALTSQHEDSLFRVKILVEYMDGSSLYVYSDPIKVVSKPSQVGKERKKKISTPDVVAETIAKREKRKIDQTLAAPALSLEESVNTGLNKSQENPDILVLLARMEKQQREQAQLLNSLMQQVSRQDLQIGKKDPVGVSAAANSDGDELEVAFDKFIAAFNRVPVQERSNKIRKIMNSQPEKSTEIVEVLLSSVPHTTAGNDTPFTTYLNTIMASNPLDVSATCHSVECQCPSCLKKEMEHFDAFYADLLSSPSSSSDV